jgi:hypothetical protein
MQIHELTRRSAMPQFNEGVMDAVKVALSRDPSIDGMNYTQAQRYLKNSAAVKKMAKAAQNAWAVYAKQLEASITDPAAKQKFVSRADGAYENALRSFVQKNLTKGAGNYANLINVSQIEQLIKSMSAPGMAPQAQAPLWQQLATSAAVAQEKSQPVTQTPLDEPEELEEPQPVAVSPGQRIKVAYKKEGQALESYYYKTVDGWKNEVGNPINGPKSIAYLEKLAVESGKTETDPDYSAPAKKVSRKRDIK